MKLDRLPYDPQTASGFFEHGLAALGALFERTWHDRLEVVAEGRAASVWGPDVGTFSGEIHFAPADATSARDASKQVFPGCPLTFRLAETLRPQPLALERVVIMPEGRPAPPVVDVAEKRWRVQFPETRKWRLSTPFTPGFHFSLLVLTRCEIQAIDQHWSLHRTAVSLPDGELDEDLAAGMDFISKAGAPDIPVAWPKPDPTRWHRMLEAAILEDLAQTLSEIQSRQQQSLSRELGRIDAYFESYAEELKSRATRTRSESGNLKAADRIAAAQAEHTRRRQDQVARHVIRIRPHLDSMLLLAEPSWHCSVEVEASRMREMHQVEFLPRTRCWSRLRG